MSCIFAFAVCAFVCEAQVRACGFTLLGISAFILAGKFFFVIFGKSSSSQCLANEECGT